MFDTTYEEILQNLLDRVDDTIDKREGSIIYNALAPAAVELMNIYDNLNLIADETFADTASKEYLVKRCKERGIYLKDATESIVKATFVPNTIDVIGKRFSCGEVNFVVTEYLSAGVYSLTCETPGEDGNLYEGALIPIDYVEGLQSASITAMITPGEAEEDTEDLRERYFNSFSSQSFGGNAADYKENVKAMSGIGGVKVYPAWNGGGTVKLVIENSEFVVPSSDLINSVQSAIDPVVNSGKGLGIAPIGHHVTVEGVTSETISIAATYTYQQNYTWADVKANVESVIDTYLKELNKNWDTYENIVVRISQIESRVLDVTGILDIESTKINGAEKNYSASANAIVIRGDVVGN